MNKIRLDHDKYMKMVGKKLNEAKNDIKKVGNKNTEGLAFSLKRIMKSSENLFFQFGNSKYDPCSAFQEAFSVRPGLTNVSDVAGIDVVDINIEATQKSVLGYLVAERGMNAPIDSLWFQGLSAMNNVGGYNAGDTVYSPYAPMNKKLRNALRNVISAEATAGGAVDFKAPLAPKNIMLTALNSAGEVVGSGMDNGKGSILWSTPSVGVTTVNYETGVVTVGALSGDVAKVTISANLDKTVEKSGANTLRLKPQTDAIQVVAQPRRLHLEQSYEDNSYMNKQAFELSQTGVELDYSKIAVNQLLTTFVSFLDFDVVCVNAEVMLKEKAVDVLDMTNYVMTTSQANTKNDVVNQYTLKLNKAIQQKSGKGLTAYLVDSEGSMILGNNPMYFVPNETFDSELNGMIGTYRGVPVIRHHVLDGINDTEDEVHAFIGGVHKSKDGRVAGAVYAEYLAPYSIQPALNFDNPAEYATGLYSMSNTQELISNYVAWIDVIVSKN